MNSHFLRIIILNYPYYYLFGKIPVTLIKLSFICWINREAANEIVSRFTKLFFICCKYIYSNKLKLVSASHFTTIQRSQNAAVCLPYKLISLHVVRFLKVNVFTISLFTGDASALLPIDLLLNLQHSPPVGVRC